MTMAESVALSFATFVVKSLGGFLIQEANNLGGVRPQVEQLQAQLNRMQCFLVAADARPKGGADEIIIRNCVAEIREASYDAEAAIATFIVKIGRSDQFPFVLKRYLCIFKENLALREVRLEIEAINTRITNSLTTGFQTCGILNSTGVGESSSSTSMAERQRQLRRSYTHIVEEDVVGTEEDVKAVVDLLVKENTHYRVVSIWGMGGLGKTTLAKTVYKRIEITRHFDYVAWAYVSQQCNIREVLEGILVKLRTPSKKERKAIGKLNHDELVKKLHQVQSENKCLVILDDIWKDADWYSLSPGFPNTTEVGSKILLTTRNENVAKHVDQQCVLYKLRHLTEKESWELFEKTFLRRNEGFTLNTEMIELGKAMVKHCGGVPLAIVVLGGLLAIKHTLNDWKQVSENISYDLGKGKGRAGVPITEILALSYQDLPYHLKACFLYLSHFPEDHDINAKKLIQMWMAEGIVSPSSIPTQVEEKEKTMLDVGMSYLDELVQRCMIQVQLTSISKRIKLCRLHDLMRDLCLLKAKEENFLEIVRIKAFGHQLAWVDSALPSSSSLTIIHRLAVYYLGDHDANSIKSENVIPLSRHEMKNHNHIRSCQFYSFGHKLKSSGWQKLKLLFKGLTLLTVLDLERIPISGNRKKCPRAIGNLLHLRYLSIRDSSINSLPSSIGNLGFLQTLDLRGRGSLRIPNVLWRLKQLRHLYLPYLINRLSCIGKLRLDGLSKLETLENFDASECDVRCLSKLTNLRKFSGRVTPKDLVVILKSPIFNDSNRLLQYSSFRILRGDFRTEEEQSLLRQLLGYHHLRQLTLWESLNKLPDQFPPNLTGLSLWNTKLEEDPMPTLEKLPNLRTLFLFNTYIGKEMVCSFAPSSISGGGRGGYGGCDGGGFPKLKTLELQFFRNLEEWRVEQGAMPCLFHLLIIECPKLKEIPDGLRFITTLRELHIKWASEALRDRVREGGEDFYKVKHVPSIIL
ncbi:putative disease resistance protein [Camellia lanceoleosa]|uniref:Disease resistance protein n=1 Tax=Camellia lanceoleosa TaxID=1840588 RepID=A0ACC0IQ52_9ERIC|nr:putative disease resistance protein [Camellia lanceoleosa]